MSIRGGSVPVWGGSCIASLEWGKGHTKIILTLGRVGHVNMLHGTFCACRHPPPVHNVPSLTSSRGSPVDNTGTRSTTSDSGDKHRTCTAQVFLQDPPHASSATVRMTWKRSPVGGVLFVVLACLSYLFGTMYVVTPWFPLMLVRPTWYRWVVDHLIAWYWYFLVALLELVYGIKVRITGDSIRPGERTLLVMNHRTRLDWMFLWMYLIRRGQLSNEKIILKNELRKVPGVGWGLETGCFLFITRRWEEDEKILKKILDYLASIGHRTQLLLFPEGTDFTEYTRKRSDAYAEKSDLPKYEYVLHPRTKGFVYITEKLIKEHNLDAIHDITVGYPNGKAQREADLLAGRFPDEVHFQVRRHPLHTLPTSPGQLEQWCTTLWAQKELQLKEFYQKKAFPDTNVLEGGTPGDPLRELKMRALLWLSVPFFLTVILVVPYLMATSTSFLISAVIICAFYIVQRAVFGGAEHFQIYLYNALHKT